MCGVARSVQTDGDDRSLSPLSPQTDENESSFDPSNKTMSPASDEPEQDSNSSRESPPPPIQSASTPVSLMLHQQAGDVYESTRPMPIKYEKLLSPIVPHNADQPTPDQLSSKSTSPMLDTSSKNSSNSSVPSSVERERETKDSFLSEVCGITQVNKAVTYSQASSSCASAQTNVMTSIQSDITSFPGNIDSVPTNVTLLPTNITSVPTKSTTTLPTNMVAAIDLRNAQTVKPVEQSGAVARSSSECFVANAPSPLSLSESVVSNTDRLQDTEELTAMMPSEENAELDKHVEKFETKEKDQTTVQTEQAERTPGNCDSSKIDLQMSNMPDSTTSGHNEKPDNEAEPSPLQSIVEPGPIDNGIEDAQESSFCENPVQEGSASESDVSAGMILRDGVHGTKLNTSDRTISDSPSHGQRADSKESPKDKSSLRSSVNARRKKPPRNSKFNWQEKVILQRLFSLMSWAS